MANPYTHRNAVPAVSFVVRLPVDGCGRSTMSSTIVLLCLDEEYSWRIHLSVYCGSSQVSFNWVGRLGESITDIVACHRETGRRESVSLQSGEAVEVLLFELAGVISLLL